MNFADLQTYLGDANVRAFLRVLREGESNQNDDAYTLLNGGGHFSDLSRHPFYGIPTTRGGKAAGAYQFLGTTCKTIWERYGIPDFSPTSQDCGAVADIIERGALRFVMDGELEGALVKLGPEWISLRTIGIDRARKIYAAYGGQETAQGPSEGVAMPDTTSSSGPSILDAIGPIATMINPIAGAIITAFSPLLKEKLTKTLQRHTDTPEVAQQVADNIIGAAQKVTGKADPIEAVVAVRNDPVAAQAVEAQVNQDLDKLAPLFDKMAQYEQASWAAEETSRDAAGARGRSDQFDLAPMLAISAILLVALTLVALAVIMGIQAWMLPEHEPTTALLTLVGPLLGVVFTGAFGAVYSYRFGSSRSSSAKDAVISQIAAKR